MGMKNKTAMSSPKGKGTSGIGPTDGGRKGVKNVSGKSDVAGGSGGPRIAKSGGKIPNRGGK